MKNKYLEIQLFDGKFNIYKAESIAIIRTDRLGDMVLTLPLANALKAELPNAEITVIARSYVEQLITNCPVVDRAIFIDKNVHSLKHEIKKNNFDVVFFPRPRYEEALAVFLGGAKLRVGSAYRAYSILFNKRIRDHRKTAEFHEAEYNTRMLEAIIGKEVETKLVKPFVPDSAIEKVDALLKNTGVSQKEYFIIHPGSRGSALDWEPRNFGLAAEIINRETGIFPIITGIASENESCSKALSECNNAVNLCGKLSMPELFALIAKARLFIANSTGTLHIAAALGTPVTGLYPNTPHISAKRWGPYTNKAAIISPPSSNPAQWDNMCLIRVETVAEKSIELINDF